MDEKLNAAQRRAVQTLRGPLLVLAGAGTGKTRVVTHRIAALIRHGIQPSRILAVTFTNKAADEMLERVRRLVRGIGSERPRISTFHSHAVDILRRHADRLGYPRRFAIYDRDDQESVARKVLRELRVESERLRPADLVHWISHWKSREIRPAEAMSLAESDKQHLAAAAYQRYQRALKSLGAMDFDDLLLCTLELFDRFSEVRQCEAARFDHLLVDEYQDTNPSQYQIIKQLAAPHRNLCVVGDDDQAIYGFRGADVTHILNFQRDWPDAVVIRLQENYRSREAILSVANRLIAFNGHRHPKILRAVRAGGEKPRIEQFPDEEAEAQGVVVDIKRRLATSDRRPRDFAILFRTNEQPRPFETQLRRLGLPYVIVGGMSFFDRTEVRDMMALLRVLDHPADEVSLLRAMQTPPRGISRALIEELLSQATSRGIPLWDLLTEASKDSISLEAKPAAAVKQFVTHVESFRRRWQQGEFAALHQMAIRYLEETAYRAYLEKRFTEPGEAETRWGNVEQVINALAAFEQENPDGTLSDFLARLSLSTREFYDPKDYQMARDAVVLMTLHSAKGLEFREVYMVGMEEGVLPHRRAVEEDAKGIDEERRLCYVGITRAQERLTFTLALTRRKWGKPRQTQPSRFLFELTGLAEHPSGKKSARQAKR